MKPQTHPFQQKLRKMLPKLEPTIKKELNKLLTTKIIFPVRHTQCDATPILPYRDTQNLNQGYLFVESNDPLKP
jgi:hypothetical protein